MNWVHYEQEIRKLADSSSYKPFLSDPIELVKSSIKVRVREALVLDYIKKDLSNFLLVDFPRVLIFYILPKIHKSGFPPVCRPIVAAQGSLHKPI